jgi:TetR/AcrR family transcriptional regulator
VTVTSAQPSPTRRPGRPPQTEQETRLAREHILAATSTVFGERGYHGANVSRVIELARISRPSFYRHFRNIDDALQVVLGRTGRSIARSISQAVGAVTGELPRLIAGIDAYLRWGEQNRALLRSLYAGAHDPANPVFALRPLLLGQLTDLLNTEVSRSGRAPLDEWTIDLFLNAMEYACYRLYLPDDRSAAAVAAARATMLRTALALLGRADDWRGLLEQPEFSRELFAGRH